jgi:hypothetical protein
MVASDDDRETQGPPKEDRPTGGGDAVAFWLFILPFAVQLLLVVIPWKLWENFGWPAVVVYFGGFALIGLCVASYFIVQDALERRATRKTVERLLALEPRSSWREWALPAPESYALLRGVTKVKSDAFKLGLLQLVAAGVLEPVDNDASSAGGRSSETILRLGPAPADTLAGSLVLIYRLWAAPTGDKPVEVKGHVSSPAVYERLPATPSHGALEITERAHNVQTEAEIERRNRR